MKVKLLKKIHSRYSWYFNVDGYPVLVDHKRESVKAYTLGYCMNVTNTSTEDLANKVTIDYKNWAMRIFKEEFLSKWGYSINKSIYREALKYSKPNDIK